MELTTCLWFNGRAREAAVFYTSIFPNSSLADNWIAPTDTPGNKQGEEIVVNFTIFGRPFIGLNGGPQFPHSEAISFQIPCKDQSEIDKYWEILTADGGQERRVTMKGNRVSIVAGVLLAFIVTRFMEDGNLLITGVATLLAATMTRGFWEVVKKIKNYFKKPI